MRLKLQNAALFVSILLFAARANSQGTSSCVQPEQSRFSIRVGSAGLFSAFGHDHLIEARQIKGCASIDWAKLEQTSVELVFGAAGITVLDPEHPKDKPQVQQTMETEVLRIADFPEIRFKSTKVHSISGDKLTVDGSLTIRGRAQSISLPLTMKRLENTTTITGRYQLKQSDFGITPVRVMGGTVRVKDEIQCDFTLVLR